MQDSTRHGVGFFVAMSGALVVYSSTVHLIPRFNLLYVPLSIIGTALVAVVAWRAGLGFGDLGLERATWRSGLRWGALVAALVAAVLLVGLVMPVFRPLFADARIAGIGPGLVAYRAIIRIPLGTALFEEFAFRGVLFGAGKRIWTPSQAAAASSLVFGLWHMRPTNDVLEANELAGTAVTRIAALFVAVLLTAAVGYLLCLLRMRSRSLLAPVVAHASINSLALAAAWIAS